MNEVPLPESPKTLNTILSKNYPSKRNHLEQRNPSEVLKLQHYQRPFEEEIWPEGPLDYRDSPSQKAWLLSEETQKDPPRPVKTRV